MPRYLVVLALVLSACGGDDKTTTNNTSTNNTSTNNTSTNNTSNNTQDMDTDVEEDMVEDMADEDMPTPTPSGTCQTAADCEGALCLPVVAGGWMTCQATISEPPSCEPNDECCLNAECTDNPGGACIAGPIFYCGGARPMEMSTCYYRECETEADCTEGTNPICLQAGLFNEPVNRCIYGGCRTNTDCSDGTNGLCKPFIDPCGRRLEAMHCVYDESECREDSDCTAEQGIPVCTIENGTPTCTEYLPRP